MRGNGARAVSLPSALASWPEIASRLAGRPLALFLDYDGTLSPIAPRPELATLPEETRRLLRLLARRWPVAILSGRAREDVTALVGLPELVYAGSHGFDIEGPAPGHGGAGLRHEVGGSGAPARIEGLAERLRRDLAGIPGVLVELKRFAVAVHYRLVGPEDLPRVEAAVDRALAENNAASTSGTSGGPDADTAGGAGRLRKIYSLKVFELRPDVDWDKGKALLWLWDALGLGRGVVALCLGDDVTDEDAFAAIDGRGIGILVAPEARPTAAHYILHDPGEARQFLERVAAL
ncbi:MAG TPA: trehalose-phosphatase [Thermoanaerobaculia bacterium]|nr:trehalose-phosphatase [Thermoanaerobaculia bacterium]